MYQFKMRVVGIPAIVQVNRFYPGWSGTYWDPPESPEVDFEILDRNGRPAPWLEAKLSDEDWEDLTEQVLEAVFEAREAERRDYVEDYA